MQSSLQKLASSLQSNLALQASALVGRNVLVESNRFKLDAQRNVRITIDMPSGLSDLTASIYAESGELINILVLGQQNSGFFQFNWDGIGQNNQYLAIGTYQIKVHGIYNGKDVQLNTMTSANVDSVSLGQNGEGLRLNVAGVGPVSLEQVKQIIV